MWRLSGELKEEELCQVGALKTKKNVFGLYRDPCNKNREKIFRRVESVLGF